MTQKVLKIGSSVAVTIPKKSLTELGIKAGDRVSVEVNPRNKSVLIRLSKGISHADQKIAKLALNFITRYRKDFELLARK